MHRDCIDAATSTVSYTGSVDASGDTRLALYGWTTNPLIEYYVVETYGSYNPGSAGQKMGSFTSDGSNYDVYKTTRTNAPSIVGTATFNQFFSIRTDKRTSGTITFQNHIDAWASFGLVGRYLPSRSGRELTDSRNSAATTTTRSWPSRATRAPALRLCRSTRLKIPTAGSAEHSI